MPIYTYAVAVRGARLMDELQAAIPTLRPVDGQPRMRLSFTPTAVEVEVPAGVTEPTVAAVVAAHNPATLSAGEQQEADDTDALEAFIADYADMLARLDTIQGLMTAIRGRADTLAGLSTWAGLTNAQLGTRLQSVMPSLGTDLGTVATEFRAVSIGLENMLQALRVVHRRQNG